MKKFEIVATDKASGEKCTKIIYAATREKALVYLGELGYEKPIQINEI